MTKAIRIYALTFISLAAVGGAACGSVEPSPTAPSPETAPPPAPAGPGNLDVTITPHPVPWSNTPIDGCSLPNTWRYHQVLVNSRRTRLTISERADSFDGAAVSTRTALGIVVAPGAQTLIRTRWCRANATEHRAQTTFFGSDDAGNRLSTARPTVRRSAR